MNKVVYIDLESEKGMLIEIIENLKAVDVCRLRIYASLLYDGEINFIENEQESKLPLPIGISDYRLASNSYYYVDKTMMIKEFLDERPQVSLFLRPRRFGKTLNMDMLRVFFEKTVEDTSCYFRDKMIWSCGEQYQRYQGKYPVIFVSFKDVKFRTWQDSIDNIADVLKKEFDRHSVLLSRQREYF